LGADLPTQRKNAPRNELTPQAEGCISHVEVSNACCRLHVHQRARIAAECMKQAHAMEPDMQKEIIIDHGDGLCSKVMIEPSTDEALNALIDLDAAKNLAEPL